MMVAEEISAMAEARSNGLTWQEVTDYLNSRFGTSRTKNSIKYFARKHGFVKKHELYTKTQDEWIRSNFNNYTNYNEMAVDFNRIFGTNKVGRGIQSRAVRYLKIISGRQGFDKGHHTHNKRQIGDEYINSHNGYTYVKVSNDNNRNVAWQAKHRVMYEQNYGKIPKGYNVIFLDGDNSNFSPDNLAGISNRTNRIMESRAWNFKNPELKKAAIKIIELEDIIDKKRRHDNDD